MEKKNINWSDLGFEYQQTELRYVSNYKDGAWDEGGFLGRIGGEANGFCRI